MKRNTLVIALAGLMLVGCVKEKPKSYYTIVWENYDHTVLETDEKVEEGTMPTYDGVTPTKPSDERFDYVFNGWTPEVSKASIDMVYTAKYYAKSASEYTVADYYDGYYKDIVSWTDGEDLKNQLNTLLHKGYTPLKYEQNWETNTEADHIKNNYFKVDAVYSAEDILTADTNKAWQREHAFCASLMCGALSADAVKTKGRATDFHNLFASGYAGNTSRGNKNFGQADKNDPTYNNAASVNNGYDGYTYDAKTFEPGEKDKGRLARAIFYMATMYKDDEVDSRSGITMKGLTVQETPVDWSKGTWTGGEFAIGNLSALLSWNNYGVDELEMQHNVSVQTHKIDGVAQGNRNPYVDYPGLVDFVYGDLKDTPGTLASVKPSAVDLDANSADHRYYTVKSAKTLFGVGEKFNKSTITNIIDMKKNFTYADYTGEFTTSLDDYTFTAADVANGINNQVKIGNAAISYHIDVENSSALSYTHVVSKDGISNTVIGTPQTVTWSGTKWNVTVNAESGYTLQNISGGGIKAGSGTKAVTSMTITTEEAKTFNAAYLKIKAGNASSSFQLKIYVGDELITTKTVTCTDNFVEYGESFEGKTGKLSFQLTGSNAIWLYSVSYNEVLSD